MDRTLTTRAKGDYLAGSFFRCGADGAFASVDPSTGLVLDRVSYRIDAVEQATADARAAAPAWAESRLEQRVDRMRKLREFLDERRVRLAPMLSRETGKPLWEANLEVVSAVRALELILEQAPRLLGDRGHPASAGGVVRRPLGVAGVLTPAPMPVTSPLALIVPALIAGNTVVWKPSSRAPLTSQLVIELFDSVRLPPGVFSAVQGPRDPIGARLLADPGVDLWLGVGDTSTVERIRAQGKPGWVQAGGKAWAFVAADADLDRAAYEVVTGAFLSGGQRPNSTARVLVERPAARELLKRVVALTRGLGVGPPNTGDVFMGPLLDRARKDAFHETLRGLTRAGLQFAVEGGDAGLPSKLRRSHLAFVAPAIAMADGGVPDEAPPPEDVEGPLLVATMVDSLEEAIEAWWDQPYGLAASIFTADEARFERLARQLQAGCVNWNRGTIVSSARFPNPGLRGSGDGGEGNAEVVLACTWAQARLHAQGPFDPSHRVPGVPWPDVMTTVDPSSLATPPFHPDDETRTHPLAMIPERED